MSELRSPDGVGEVGDPFAETPAEITRSAASRDVAIRAESLSKRFKLNTERRDSLKERFVRGKGAPGKEFWALRDATFDVPRGGMFGIIGHNGSGKSTALKVIAGIYRPTSGKVTVNGRISALLELGAGFHPELTGRENISLNGSILGMTSKEIAAATPDIIEFSGLGDFIDSPIKVYSSGMHVRLGFAIAVKVNPEILVIDEVIAVGDEDFQRKCFDYIYELRRRGSTIVIVTHSMGIVREKCDEVMWLDHGRVREIGTANDVVDAYMRSVNVAEAEAKGQALAEEGTIESRRRGTGEVQITGVEVRGADGGEASFLVSGEKGTIRLHYAAREALPYAIFGVAFFSETGVNVAGPNSQRTGPQPVPQGEGYIDFDMTPVLLAPGSYELNVAAVHDGHVFDFVDKFFTVKVRGSGSLEPGLVRLPGNWGAVTPS